MVSNVNVCCNVFVDITNEPNFNVILNRNLSLKIFTKTLKHHTQLYVQGILMCGVEDF
jgi:hypothetical protein